MTRTLGFESLPDWHVLVPGPRIELSSVHSEGASSLSLWNGGWMEVESRKLSKEQAAPSLFGFDVRIPANSPNPGWLGDAQLFIHAPSVGLNNEPVGNVPLTQPGQFQRVEFTLSTSVKTKLNQNYSDLQFRIAVNAPNSTAEPYRLDRLTFGKLCVPVSDGNPCTSDVCEDNLPKSKPLPAGTNCDNGDLCDGVSTCSASAQCVAGTPPALSDDNPCTVDSCVPATGVQHTPAPSGTACNDGNACTTVDGCVAGACVGSSPVACAPANRCHPAGTCNAATGVCDFPADETSCSQTLTIRVPPAMNYRAFAVGANGALDLRERVTVKGPIANMGSTWTHIASDDSLVDVYTKPAVTVEARAVLKGRLRTGSSASVSTGASVVGGVSSAFFEPPAEHTLTFDVPTGTLQNIVVDADQTRTLAPGGYGQLLLRPRARLALSSGDYYFEHFDTALADAFVDSVFTLNERNGAVRIFVQDPFTFRSSIRSTSQPPDLVLAVLGSGDVRVERPFAGTLLAPEANLTLASFTGAEHTAGFFAKNVTVNADVVVKALPRQPHSCHPADFRRASAAACSASDVEIVRHEGVTRAIFEGEETFGTGKRVQPVEGFTFEFDRAVSLEKARGAVQILSASCPESVLAEGCTHDVMLEAQQIGTDGKTVRLSNDNDPFLPGCRYKLRIDTAPLTTGGECLADASELSFVSLSPEDGSALAYETRELRTDPRSHEAASFEFEDAISWQADEFFSERIAALGLRPGIDSLVTDGKVRESTLWPNSEFLVYRQNVAGVPVANLGYTVHRDHLTGRVLNVTGHAEKSVAAPPPATVSESAALAVAKAQVPGVATTSAPAKLELLPTNSGAKTFKLAYRFVLTDSERFIRRRVDVDATTGAVLNSVDGQKTACKSVDTSKLVTPEPSEPLPITLDTLQQQHGDPDPTTFDVTEYTREPEGTSVFALDSRGGAPVSGVPLGRPSVYAECPGQSYPNVVELPSDHSDASWDPEIFTAAQLQLAAGACLDYFANRPVPYGPGGAQWSGWDWQGLEPIEIQLNPDVPANNAAYRARLGGGPELAFNPLFFGGAMIDVVCHEFMHGIWDHFGYEGSTPEARSLNEAVADIFGSAAEYAQREDEASLWCMIPRDLETNCDRALDAPNLSRHPQPTVHHGPNYCEAPDCLEEHVNASIMTYWFYLVTRGGTAAAELGCGQAVTPIDPDPKKAIDMATEIVFTALREGLYVVEGDFADMANATITAAGKLYPGAPTDTVMAAWHAVNIWENYKDDPNEKVSPARGELTENSWVQFSRKLPDGVPEMDIQVDINETFDSFKSSPGDPGSPLVESTVPTVEVPVFGAVRPVPVPPDWPTETRGGFSVALEPGQKYFWRSRPHSNAAWGNCEPIFWFTAGDTPGVGRIVPRVSDPRAGSLSLSAARAGGGGALQYKFQISDKNTKCVSRAGVEEHLVDPLIEYFDDHPHPQPNAVATFDDLQPEHDYWLNVLPFGPDDPDGNQAEGRCYAQQFRTQGLEAPDLLSSSLMQADYFGEQPELQWRAPKGTRYHRIRLYPIDELGGCDYGTIAHEQTLEQLCDGFSGCLMSTQVDDFGVRNASGYCWDVTGISTDLHESPSIASRFRYRLDSLGGRSPGVQIADTENDRIPAPLPGDSYDQPVEFTWDAQPGVLGYMVRVGRYPWDSGAVAFDLEPAEETLPPTFTADNFLEVEDGSLVSRGRYCWTVWPVLEDPDHPGEIWKRQPRVDKYPPYCYTSGPSEPEIKFKRAHVKPGGRVDGTIEFAYVPDSQFTISGWDSPTFGVAYGGCKNRGPYYRDKYDCVIKFAAIAQKGQYVRVTVNDYNSPLDVHAPLPAPPYDDLPPVHTVTEQLAPDECGTEGKECCGNGLEPCEGANLGCDAGICRTCGARNQVCCPSGKCKDPEDSCQHEGDAMRCRECGLRGQQCCDNRGGTLCDIGQGPCINDICDISQPSNCNASLTAVNLTGPLYAVGAPPHYADVNGAPQAACALPELFGKLGTSAITWDTPSSGHPQRYLLTFYPGEETRYVSGTANIFYPFFQPQENPCGVIGVTIRAVDGCGHEGPIGPTSRMYMMWQ